MNILITAGGTAEKIDQVRSITNHSTGSLGKAIAETFLSAGHHVTYVTTAQAKKPGTENKQLLDMIEIETTEELQNVLTQQFRKTTFDSVIHSMAVSDFTTENSTSEEAFIQFASNYLANLPAPETKEAWSLLLKELIEDFQKEKSEEKKISSDTNRLLLFLKKNPKIISMIRHLQPATILIGFKLLVNVPEEELIQVGLATLKKNDCDYVLANDLTSIKGTQHHGLLLNAHGKIAEAKTKEEIAELLKHWIEKSWREKQ